MSMNFGIAEYWYDLYDFLLENTLHLHTLYTNYTHEFRENSRLDFSSRIEQKQLEEEAAILIAWGVLHL